VLPDNALTGLRLPTFLAGSTPLSWSIDLVAFAAGSYTFTMDTSYLSQQVTTIIERLHGFFDEIGVPSHERDSRESEVSIRLASSTRT